MQTGLDWWCIYRGVERWMDRCMVRGADKITRGDRRIVKTYMDMRTYRINILEYKLVDRTVCRTVHRAVYSLW